MQSQRSNASHRIREAGPNIFKCPNNLFNDMKQQASWFKEIGFTVNEQGVGHYTKYAKILYRDYSGVNNKWKVFRNPVLMKVC